MAGKAKILLMDDEQIILDVTNEVLTFLGYDVMFAQDGAAAVELYKREKETKAPFDIVILDLSVPEGMGGKEAMQKLREFDPAVKAIVSSGYSSDPVLANYRAHGFCGMVAKPYEVAEFARVLREALGEPRPA